jgi:hypothetical protein
MNFKSRILGLALAAISLTSVAGGCGSAPAAPAEKTANAFMEAYYVRADLQEASALADGLALDKVSGSASLREGLAIDSAAQHPKVRFELSDSRAGRDEAEYLYDVDFRPEKSEAVRKTARIKVRLRDGRWKVTQFTDHER